MAKGGLPLPADPSQSLVPVTAVTHPKPSTLVFLWLTIGIPTVTVVILLIIWMFHLDALILMLSDSTSLVMIIAASLLLIPVLSIGVVILFRATRNYHRNRRSLMNGQGPTMYYG